MNVWLPDQDICPFDQQSNNQKLALHNTYISLRIFFSTLTLTTALRISIRSSRSHAGAFRAFLDASSVCASVCCSSCISRSRLASHGQRPCCMHPRHQDCPLAQTENVRLLRSTLLAQMRTRPYLTFLPVCIPAGCPACRAGTLYASSRVTLTTRVQCFVLALNNVSTKIYSSCFANGVSGWFANAASVMCSHAVYNMPLVRGYCVRVHGKDGHGC